MKKILLAGAACAALAAGTAIAGQTISGTQFKVSVTVPSGCTIQSDVGSVTFIATQGGPPADVQTPPPTVQCNTGSNYIVYFTSANAPTGTTRYMKDPTPNGSTVAIPYEIYGCVLAQGGGGNCSLGAAGTIGPIPSDNTSQLSVNPTTSYFTLLFHIKGANNVNPQANVTYQDLVTMQLNF